jgi:ribulose-phosphate 3-epimerase
MTRTPYASTAPMIAASILSASFSRLAEDINQVLHLGADFLHLDILDGHFAPNISFGPHVIAGVKQIVGERAYLDAHLMVSDPLKWAKPMVAAGADNITFHIEAVTDPLATIKSLRDLGCHVGITLKPATDVATLYPFLKLVDLILVMSVNPGFSGQKFMPDMLEKVRELKKRISPNQRIEIDGGINADTIADARLAGVDWFVVASAIFDAPDRGEAIHRIRGQMSNNTL